MSRAWSDHSGIYIEERDEDRAFDEARQRDLDEEIPTSHGPRTLAAIIGDLTYINYAHNRTIAPHITPQSWEKVYGPEVDAMEERYQAERKAA